MEKMIGYGDFLLFQVTLKAVNLDDSYTNLAYGFKFNFGS